ncbi:MAG: ATP-binding cassette domain-containing protein [Rubrimonas sp.]|uniref:ATP-binding cassette domain-containing protein n=1 Tax=Rubrimonas sp. TaxID=2036015 RepID=UPI002FDE3097
MKGLRLEGLRIALRGRTLVALDVDVGPGEIATVMGPSGAGKSTLLAAIAGAAPPDFEVSGRVLLDGGDVTGLPIERRRIGLLFQDDLLFPHLSVGGNLGFGLPRGAPDRAARIEAALDEAGLAGFGPRDPATLSGGQRARVAVMRALLAEPRALLLDEPFSRLDADLRARFRGFVFERLRARGLPALLVTHDPDDARAAGGPVLTVGEPGAA